ncbi:hypothetical protein [Streptomyces sp. NPDC005773]|uniref:hypothetical protein n=1 Tax=Streptomyces sp. NPDC005773 TaxID=3364727 RepID=UPI0036A005C2
MPDFLHDDDGGSGGAGRSTAASEAGHTDRTRGQVHWAPFRQTERSAVAAIDLLRRPAAEDGGGHPPAPRDPEVARFLGATHRTHRPAPRTTGSRAGGC